MPEKMSIRERLLAVIGGRKPDRIPFISRMDFWFNGLAYQHKLPDTYNHLDLKGIHARIGLGMEAWHFPCALKLNGAELVIEHEGRTVFHETDPEVTNFPSLWGMVPANKPGTSEIRITTPKGTLVSTQKLVPESLAAGAWRPMTTRHPLHDEADIRTCIGILEACEFVPRFSGYFERSEEVGDNGFVVPMLNRSPFQCLLLDGFGETNLFYALHDTPNLVESLLNAFEVVNRMILKNLAAFDMPYIEFCENLDAAMTNPRLFTKYVLPSYQAYAQILHGQGKRLGAHLDGNLAGLEGLIAESGIDVCESFTPAPQTGLLFADAWKAWQKGPLIWGGIPSVLLEARTSRQDFEQYADNLLETIANRPVILGVADAVMPEDALDRVAWLAERIKSIAI